MQNYREISVEELLQICKNKMRNGRTYDELRYFLQLHKIDADKQKYIFTQLEAFEIELANEPKPKKKLHFSPLNLVFGTLLMLAGMALIMSGFARSYIYYAAVFTSLSGVVMVFIEIGKAMFNQFND